MRIAGFRPTSLFDGVGINAVIFTQGCRHHCEGCHNPSTWDMNGGTEVSVKKLEEMIEPYLGFITGVTFSGGDPVEQFDEVSKLARWAKEHGLTTTLYTGYVLDELIPQYDLSAIDYIIDGEFIDDYYDSDVPFRGSWNQAIYFHNADDSWEEVA